MSSYQIFTDATADLTAELLQGLPHIEIIPMQVQIAGQEFTYGPSGSITPDEFYAFQQGGAFATTSQVNPDTYRKYFELYLKQGKDILYICFSSGLSSTIQSALIAMEELKEAYPERQLILFDSLAASTGEGMFVMEAAKRQLGGMELSELHSWLLENRQKLCHWVTVDTFDHLKHGGRVSSTTAAVGTLLNIKPLIHVDENGKLVAAGKPRGRKKAQEALVASIKKGWQPEISNQVIIGHGDYPDAAEELKDMVSAQFPTADIRIARVGPIVGAHTGPGLVVIFFWGNNR